MKIVPVRALLLLLVASAACSLPALAQDPAQTSRSKRVNASQHRATHKVAVPKPTTASPARLTSERPRQQNLKVVAALDINTAGKPELSPLPVLSSQAKSAIFNFRAGGPYANVADFASKVCSRVAVDFGPTDIMIGGALYQGFTCAVPASGSYVANGSSNAYALAVEVTGSAITPPAPPAQ